MRRGARRWWPVLAVLFAIAMGALGAGALWAGMPGPGTGRPVDFTVPEQADPGEIAALLARAGLTERPGLFALYLRVGRPSLELAPGPHLLNDALSPKELVQRLARLGSRPVVRVTLPEGYNSLQIAERLETAQVCSRGALRRALVSEPLLRELGIEGESAEGYLFPSTYELSVDSSAAQVVRTLVREMRRRLQVLRARHAAAVHALQQEFGWGEHEILTLASIVEREAAEPDEQPLIASVFFNRLRSTSFQPKGTLQSDPTAAYGCWIAPESAPSCFGFSGRVTPAMLRDPLNRYNTYRHAGLPPGPIGNPGERAIQAVFAPARSDYLFFFASGGRRHTFSRTFEEHRKVVRGKTAKLPTAEELAP